MTQNIRFPFRTALAAAAGLTLFGHAAAQSAPEAAPASTTPSTQWGLGLAVGAGQQPYRDAGNKTRVLPVLYVENAWLHVMGTSADLKLGSWQFGVGHTLAVTGRLKYEGGGYEDDDAPILRGMDERKNSLWAGPTLRWSTPYARLSADWTADVSGHSKGNKLQLQLDRRFGFGQFALTPRIQAQWLDRKYVDYYYGVTAGEAQAGRPQYSGRSATVLEFGLRVDYALRPKQTIFLDIGTSALPDEIKHSPLVGRSSVTRAAVGYLYRF